MPRPRRIPSLVYVVLALIGPAALAEPATEPRERVVVAHLLAYGRVPVSEDSSTDSLDAQLARHRANLAANQTARDEVAKAAWRDAFGRDADASELRTETTTALLYHERMKIHSARLENDSAEYTTVINRAYRQVVHRDSHAEELTYWRLRSAHSFVALVACIEDWARRNQPGLMVTSGEPTVPARSRFVEIVPLSPAVAAEVRASLRLPEEARVLACGAPGVSTPGKMHLALVGSR